MMHRPTDRPTKSALPEGEVHVWRAALDGAPRSVEGGRSCLSVDELTRAAQFIAPLGRRRFALSRVVLRHVLAGYHGIAAAEIPIARESSGRPYVQGADGLFFSLSHSGGTALVAVAGVPVGVDVERVRPVPRAAGIARRILHPATVAVLEGLPRAQYVAAFLDAWTQREAHVKAVGGGLCRTVDVLPFDPLQPDDATVHTVVSRADGSEWSVARFRPYDATRAAVAAPGTLSAIRILDYDLVHETTEESE